MDDYALVLNAGSSSLKFCVYRRPGGEAWRLAARGQIDGIGTSPRLTREGRAPAPRWSTRRSTRRCSDGRAALDVARRVAPRAATPARACSASATASCTAAPSTPAPCVVTPEVLADLRTLIPLAPLHQPHNLAAIEAVSERLPDVPQVACFDTELPPRPTGGRRAGAAAEGDPRHRRAALRLPRALLRVHRVGAARGRAGRRRRPRDRRPPRQRREPLRARRSGRASTARSASRRSTGSAWARGPGSIDPGVDPAPLPDDGALGRRGREAALQAVGPARHLRASATTCATCSTTRTRRRGSRSTTSSTRPRSRSARSPPCSAGVDALVFTAGIGEHSAEIRRRICEASAWLGVDARPGGERRARAAHHDRRTAACRPGWSRPTRN